jgi:hypothetical protein
LFSYEQVVMIELMHRDNISSHIYWLKLYHLKSNKRID